MADRLYGGQQDDTLDGGAQIYLTDFTRGEDRIDLSDMGVGFGDVIKSGNWLHVGTLWINTGLAAQVTASDFVFCGRRCAINAQPTGDLHHPGALVIVAHRFATLALNGEFTT